jgi:DNA-binding transcriptional regulator GbsR (MarR family)
MLRLLRRKKDIRNDMEHVLILKKNLQRESHRMPSETYDMEHIKDRLEEISQKLSHLHSRMDSIEGKRPETVEDGVKKSKVKKVIEENLGQHGKLTSYDLAQILNLSRTRCSEYLNEMERSGMIKGVTMRRKRFYEIVNAPKEGVS